MKQEATSNMNAFTAAANPGKKNIAGRQEAHQHPDLAGDFAKLSPNSCQLVLSAINTVRRALNNGFAIPPHILVEDNTCTGIVKVDDRSNDAMTFSANCARNLARQTNAEFAMLVSMNWVLPESQRKNTHAVLAKYGRISNYPASELVVLFHLETRHGRHGALVPILDCPPSQTRKKLGEVNWQDCNDAVGTFVRMVALDSAH